MDSCRRTMAAISKNERLLNLVAFFLKSHRPASVSEVLGSVEGYRGVKGASGTLERRFERDKAALRELGVPLRFLPESEPGGPGYVIPRESYFLPRLQLSSAEAAILALAGRFVLAGAAGPVSDALSSALRKLQFDSAIPGEIRETTEEHFLFQRVGATGNERERENLRELTAAALNRRAVSFSYYAIGQDRVARRVVEPYGIGFSDGHWYLVGNDRKRKDVRVFRTDRIHAAVKRVRPDGIRPEYEIPAGFRVQDHVGVPPWLFGRATRLAVRIRLDSDVAFMVRMRPAPGDRWEDHSDGSATLTRQATHLDSLLNWVLGFGHHAEVLAPAEFRKTVAETLRGIAALHEGRGASGGDGHG